MTPAPLHGAPKAWSGSAWIGAGWAMFDGHAGDNRPHAHHALQLALGVDAPVVAQIGLETPTAHALLIAADVPHALRPGKARLLYVERESSAGRLISATLSQEFRAYDETAADALRAAWPTERATTALRPILRVLCADVLSVTSAMETRSLDRIRSVIASLPRRVGEPIVLAALAAEASLSPSRFTHCFKAITGMAVRPYLRWLRLAQALTFAAEGDIFTQAAHRAGFADAAHLTRTMRRHFGIAPRDIVGCLRAD